MGEKSEVIIDTDILIKIYRGNKEHKRVLEAISQNLIIFCITKMELLVGCINNIIKKYSFSHKMSVADTLIAATAFSYSLELFTDNKKHFNFIEGLTLFSPDL
jgi:predicted nucleic acid-binding protein